MDTLKLTLPAGMRLDRAIAEHSALSRSRAQALIKEGRVRSPQGLLNDPSYLLKAALICEVDLPDAAPSWVEAENIPLEVVYEDADLLVINKPAGMTVHPAAGHARGTLVHALLYHCGDSLSGIGGVARPGIVHRLDKDTSGLMVVAKHDEAHLRLAAQLARRTLSRAYLALVWGRMSQLEGTLEGAIGRCPANRKKMAMVTTGKKARTHYREARVFWTSGTAQRPARAFTSLMECRLETGRTHQIRVHFSAAGHGLVGDPLYGAGSAQRLKAFAESSLKPEVRQALLHFPRQALHAAEIGFVHPASGEALRFEAPLPEDMKELLAILDCQGLV